MATRISSKYLKISKVLDWGFFLILFGLAIFFVWSVLQQYSNKDTSFTQYQQPIKKRPTITICIPFFGYPHNINRTDLKFKWIYGKQFTFTYQNTVLKQGQNSIAISKTNTENVYLEEIIGFINETCFKISSSSSNKNEIIEQGTKRKILMKLCDDNCKEIGKNCSCTEDTNNWNGEKYNFKNTLTYHQTLGHIGIDTLVQKLGITIYFTSEDNSYGIIDQKWMNGEEMSIGTKFGTSKTIKIRPESRTMLVETSKCGEDHHYKCYGYKLISTMEKCPKKCLAITVPQKQQKNIPYCAIDKAEMFYKNIYHYQLLDVEGKRLIDMGASELKQYYDTMSNPLFSADYNSEKIDMQHYIDYNCSLYWAKEILANNVSTESCPPTCEILEYKGKIVKDESFNCFVNPNEIPEISAGAPNPMMMECKFMDFSYEFASPEYVKTYEEYLICDGKTMIGNVGGTFGMFIGFSFSNVISKLIEIFQRLGRNRQMF